MCLHKDRFENISVCPADICGIQPDILPPDPKAFTNILLNKLFTHFLLKSAGSKTKPSNEHVALLTCLFILNHD